MFSKVAVLSTLLGLAVSSPVGSSITKFGLNGSGCPSGTFQASLTGNNIVAQFSQFNSVVGGNAQPLDARTNCQATIQVQSPPGFQFAPADVVYSGSVNINAGVTASRTSLYYFQGKVQQDITTTSATGPLNANGITVTDSFTQKGGFSACGGSSIVNINVYIDVNNGNGTAKGSNNVDTATFGNFIWQEC